MQIIFPKTISNNIKTYNFLHDVYRLISETRDTNVVFDLSNTKNVETNLLVLFSLIIRNAEKRQIPVYASLPNKKQYKNQNMVIKIFEYYTNEKKAFLKPRCVVGNNNKREVEDLLTKYLKELNLLEHEKIKTLISELITNIKMHVEKGNNECRGYISSHYAEKENLLYVSIGNDEISVQDALRNNNLVFTNDDDAIFWSLKKKNSTRKKEESGGIGLYLLRKYINLLKGEAYICSGKIFMHFDGSCYNEKKENEIAILEKKELTTAFNGSIFTLCIPYQKNTGEEINTRPNSIELDLSSFMEA